MTLLYNEAKTREQIDPMLRANLTDFEMKSEREIELRYAIHKSVTSSFLFRLSQTIVIAAESCGVSRGAIEKSVSVITLTRS